MGAPAGYALQKLIITSASGVTLDITNIYTEINIFEDIFNSSIHGTLVLNDANNYIKNLPIYGNETLDIAFSSPNGPQFNGSYRIYKIEKRTLPKERWQVYQLTFVSKETILNPQVRVSKSYTGLISDIAKDIQTNYLKSKFNLLEPTKYIHKLIIPATYTPMSALNWLATRANSNQYSGSNYFYFETKEGFNFTSLEKLMDIDPVVNYKYQIVTGANSTKGLPSHQYSVDNYNYDHHIETLDNMMQGMYGNQLVTHNHIRKVWTEHTFDYVDSWDDYVHCEENQLAPASFTPSKYGAQRFFPTEEGFNDNYNHVESWLPSRISQLQQLQNTHITIRVPGDSTRKVGEMVNFFIPSPEPVVNDQQLDTFAGKFLITSLRHVISTRSYYMAVGLSKDSVSDPLP